MNTLKLTLLQADLIWESRKANLLLFDKLLADITETDLILLPEMFSTGFSMKPKSLWDSPEGETFDWLKKKAEEKQAAISGSVIIKDEGHYYNRLYFVTPEGEYYTYDKKHLFTLAGEEKVYSSGKEKLTLEYKGWKITPLICYDLRFPVWCRNAEHSDLMYFVANWPERRAMPWSSLLKARAIENMCYVAGLNRVGDDGEGVSPIVALQASDVLVAAQNNTRVNMPPFGNNNQGQSRPVMPLDGVLTVLEPDLGRLAGHFDRNTFFNDNGAGTNINRFDNLIYAINLFTWLADTNPDLQFRDGFEDAL